MCFHEHNIRCLAMCSFVIGKKGANVQKVEKECQIKSININPNGRIVIVGSDKEEVNRARAMLEFKQVCPLSCPLSLGRLQCCKPTPPYFLIICRPFPFLFPFSLLCILSLRSICRSVSHNGISSVDSHENCLRP